MNDKGVAAWKFPPIVAAIAVTIVGAFYLGGPGLGMAIGSLSAAVIVLVAVRHPPRRPIGPPPPPDSRRRILVALNCPLEGEAVEALAETVREEAFEPLPPQVVLLAPSRSRFLDRWASDVGPGRAGAQRSLVLSVASLATAEIDATARVGDEDLVQMVEDELQTFPATEVILVTDDPAGPSNEEAAEAELESRLCVAFRSIHVQAVPRDEHGARRRRPSRQGRRPSLRPHE